LELLCDGFLKNKGAAGRAWSNWSIVGTFVYIYSAEADMPFLIKNED